MSLNINRKRRVHCSKEKGRDHYEKKNYIAFENVFIYKLKSIYTIKKKKKDCLIKHRTFVEIKKISKLSREKNFFVYLET